MLEFLPAKSKFGGNNPGRIVKLADEARGRRDWNAAALHYQKAYRLRPERLDLLVQFANVSKEARNFGGAYAAYSKALESSPNDADILLQLGHLMKVTGNLRAASDFYSRSADAGDTRASIELEAIRVVSLDLARDIAESRLTSLKMSGGLGAGFARALIIELLMFNCERPNENSILGVRRLLTGDLADLAEGRAFVTLASLFMELQSIDSQHSTGWQPVLKVLQTEKVTDNKFLHDFVEALTAASQNMSASESDISELQTVPVTYCCWDAQSAADKTDQIFSSVGSLRAFHDQVILDTEVGKSCRSTAWVDSWNDHRQDVLVLDVEDELALVRACLLSAASAMAHSLFLSLRLYWTTPWPADLVYRLAMMQAGPMIDLRPLGPQTEVASARVFDKINTVLSSHPEFDQKRELFDSVHEVLVLLVCSSQIRVNTRASVVADLVRHQRRGVVSQVWQHWLSGANRSLTECRIAGNILRESGNWTTALALFRSLIERATEAHSEITVDLAITEKTCGNFSEAANLFKRAFDSDIQRDFCLSEYVRLLPEVFDGENLKEKILGAASPSELRSIVGDHFLNELLYDSEERVHQQPGHPSGIEVVEALLPVRGEDRSAEAHAGIRMYRVGSGEAEVGGRRLPLCSGISAVRVDVTSEKEVVACRLRIAGRTLCREMAREPVLKQDASGKLHYEYRFNIWFDADRIETKGTKTLELYFEETTSGYFTHRTQVVLGASQTLPNSSSGKDLATRVAELPTEVYSARRSTFSGPINRVVFVRPDQLGDAVCSIGGVVRLRELFPGAEIVGIVSRSNSGLFRSLGIVDKLIEIDFSYNEVSRRRTLSLTHQERLIQEFGQNTVDLAIDLSPGADSRPILKLTGARYKVGFSPDSFPWLNLGVEIRASTNAERRQSLSQGAMIRSLLEAVSIAASADAPIMSGRAAAEETLRDLDLKFGNYVLLHSGARTESRKWPIEKYLELAGRVISERHLPVVFFADAEDRKLVETELQKLGDKFRPMFHLASFEAFDQVLSGAAVFVGNDSGPKHLAAYRGVPTVSLHMGAVPWEEWGQEAAGVIMSRWVPCIGCGIELNRECGRGIPCLTDIKAIEVAEQVFRALDEKQ